MRRPVPLPQCYRLLNHGPTVLVTSADGARRNVMAAAWNMALDFDPPKMAVVIDKSTFTRELVEASGEFALNLPCRSLAALTVAVGSATGRELSPDKLVQHGLSTVDGSRVGAPLIEGCVGWLECRVLPEPPIQQRYDLFVAEVVAAWADERVFSAGRWRYAPGDDPALRTLHYVAGGQFFATGDPVEAARA